MVSRIAPFRSGKADQAIAHPAGSAISTPHDCGKLDPCTSKPSPSTAARADEREVAGVPAGRPSALRRGDGLPAGGADHPGAAGARRRSDSGYVAAPHEPRSRLRGVRHADWGWAIDPAASSVTRPTSASASSRACAGHRAGRRRDHHLAGLRALHGSRRRGGGRSSGRRAARRREGVRPRRSRGGVRAGARAIADQQSAQSPRPFRIPPTLIALADLAARTRPPSSATRSTAPWCTRHASRRSCRSRMRRASGASPSRRRARPSIRGLQMRPDGLGEGSRPRVLDGMYAEVPWRTGILGLSREHRRLH